MLLGTLGFIAIALTVAMFATRNAMLGFPSAIFWALVGGYAYTQSVVPWGDIYFYFAFASLLGMVTFTALGAYGLRERRDTIAEVEMDDDGEEEGAYIDEPERKTKEPEMSSRVKALRERAKRRKGRGSAQW